MSQLSFLVAQKNAENDRDVRYIMKSFKDDGFTVQRLKLCLVKAEQYENKKNGGSRGNRNMIRAIELLLI